MKTWMKQLENSFSAIPDTDSYDEEVEKEIKKEGKKILRSIMRTCKEEGIQAFYAEEDGMIVVDDIANLVK